MKKFSSNLIVLILFSALFTLISCSEKNSNSNVPELLTRSVKIQLDKEWEAVQNAYMENKMAVDNDPLDHASKLNLAYIFINEARVTGEHGHYYPAALHVLNDILAHNALTRDVHFRTLATKAGVQLSLHEFEKAKVTADKAIALNAQNSQIYGVLTDASVELGDYENAVRYADRMISIKPDLRSYARVSYLREINGDIDGAMDAFKLSIEAGVPGFEDRAWAMVTLGEILMKYDKDKEAEGIFKTILNERENYPFAVGAIAELAYKKGDLQLAEAKFEEATDIIPEVGFYIGLARIYKDQNREEEFASTIEEVLAMLEDDVVHGHNMNLEYADLYLNLLENPDKAYEYAFEEYQKRPQNIDVNKVMAQVLLAKRDLERATPYIQASLVTNSQDPEIKKLEKVFMTGQLSAL